MYLVLESAEEGVVDLLVLLKHNNTKIHLDTSKVRPGGRSLPDCSKKAPAAAATVVRRGHSTSRERESAQLTRRSDSKTSEGARSRLADSFGLWTREWGRVASWWEGECVSY